METTTSLKTFEVTIPEKYADILKKFITSLEGKVKAQKKSGEFSLCTHWNTRV